MAKGREEPLRHLPDGPGPSGDSSKEIARTMARPQPVSESKKKGFHPLRAVRKIFRRKGKHSVKDAADSRMASSMKSRSTSELPVGNDGPRRSSASNNSSHLGTDRLCVSHESVFSPEHDSDNDMRNAQSIQNLALQKELVGRLNPHRDSDEDDVGLPRSPCTSPTTAEVLRQGLQATSGKSRSTCSDGSLMSMESLENEEDSVGQNVPRQSRLSARGGDPDMDMGEGASFPLSHKAAHHKLSVRPKRTRAVGRHRKLQQLTVASLPATPEDIEEPRAYSPDHSWPSLGDRETTGSSGSISRASSAMSTSDSTGSLTASPTRKKVLPTPQDGVEIPTRSRSSIADWKVKHDTDIINRRRTVSESPSREFESRNKDSSEMDGRAQSANLMDSREPSRASAPWLDATRERYASPGQKDSGKEVRQISPIRKSRPVSPFQADMNRNRVELGTEVHSYDRLGASLSREDSRPISPIRPHPRSALPPSPLQLRKSTDLSSAASNSQSKVGDGVALNGTPSPDEFSSVRRSVQRDPSYRVAVHDSRSWEEELGTSAKPEKAKKEKEESSSIFSFGSKGKKSGEAVKDKMKDKKDEKEKAKKPEKDKKEETDSPFFSRFWGSRRSSRKKKDKKDEEEEDISPPPVITPQEVQQKRESTESTVDVKAMIQSITARSSFSSGSPHPKDRDQSPKALPTSKARTGSGSSLQVESSHYSKSLESLSGPKSLDSMVPVDVEAQPTRASRLSGSMPRLDTSASKLSRLPPKPVRSTDALDESAADVLIVEGEAVPLRRKLATNDRNKELPSPVERDVSSEAADQKKSSKLGSKFSWYGKKESTPAKSKLDSLPPSAGKRGSGLWSKSSVDAPSSRKGSAADSKSTSSQLQDFSQPHAENSYESFGRTSSISSGESNRSSGFDEPPKSDKRKPSEMPTKVQGDLQSSTEQKSSRITIGDKVSTVNRRSLTRTPSPEKAAKPGAVPEFMRVQLNRVKSGADPDVERQNKTTSIADSDSGRRRKSTSSNDYSSSSERMSPVRDIKRQTREEHLAPSAVDTCQAGKPISSQDVSEGRLSSASFSPARSSFRKTVADSKEVAKTESAALLEKGQTTPSKFTRVSTSESKPGESELFKVFHRRSLKIKDPDKQSKLSATEPEVEKSVQQDYLESDIGPCIVEPEVEPALATSTPKPTASRAASTRSQSSSPAVQQEKPRSSMADKRSISLCQEPTPMSRPRTVSSPGTSLPTASIEIVSKGGESFDASMPEWRRLAQQRREQREMRERQHVTGNGHTDSQLIMQSPPKHSGRSKVLDLVSNFQKLQVS